MLKKTLVMTHISNGFGQRRLHGLHAEGVGVSSRGLSDEPPAGGRGVKPPDCGGFRIKPRRWSASFRSISASPTAFGVDKKEDDGFRGCRRASTPGY